MSIHLEKQILITKSAMEMLTDIHSFKARTSFPHYNRTGLSQSQVFGLLSGIDPLVPYYIKNSTTTTTTDEKGNWNWTFLLEYTSQDRTEILSWQEETAHSVSFLSAKLFKAQMPDYVKVYRACAFLAGSANYENDPKSHPFIHNAYGAFIKGSCGCQGYAMALKLLLDAAGVPCMIISGPVLKGSRGTYECERFDYDIRTKSTCHYWNLVGIETTAGTQYFHVDVCWGQQDHEMNFEYFLKDDYFMQQSRKWDYDSYPPCRVLPGNDIEALVKASV